MSLKPYVVETCFGLPFSRWVLPIADGCNPFRGIKIRFYLTFLSLKGINMSAQGIALRHQDRYKTSQDYPIV
jgi:hypothetical protein